MNAAPLSAAAARMARVAPWLLLWIAAPLPLWLALGLSWWFHR